MENPSQPIVFDVEQQCDQKNTVPAPAVAVAVAVSAEEYHPPASLNCLTITCIILCITGIGFGVAAGYCADVSHSLECDRQWAKGLLTLSFAIFAVATPLLLCNIGEDQVREMIAWVVYLCGMILSLILLVTVLFLGDDPGPWLYYLTTMCNFVPYMVMMMRC